MKKKPSTRSSRFKIGDARGRSTTSQVGYILAKKYKNVPRLGTVSNDYWRLKNREQREICKITPYSRGKRVRVWKVIQIRDSGEGMYDICVPLFYPRKTHKK